MALFEWLSSATISNFSPVSNPTWLHDNFIRLLAFMDYAFHKYYALDLLQYYSARPLKVLMANGFIEFLASKLPGAFVSFCLEH